MQTVLALGNCQGGALAEALRNLVSEEERMQIQFRAAQIHSDPPEQLRAAIRAADVVVTQPFDTLPVADLVREELAGKQVHLFPRIFINALFPDHVHVSDDSGLVFGPTGFAHSALGIFGWSNGLTAEETVGLFSEEVFNRLGYLGRLEPSLKALEAEGELVGMDLGTMARGWLRRGNFMHIIAHPKLFVTSEIAMAVSRKLGFDPRLQTLEDFMVDPFVSGPVWPVHPLVAQSIGIEGGSFYKGTTHKGTGQFPIFDLSEFIAGCFSKYDAARNPKSAMLETPRFLALRDWLGTRRRPVRVAPGGNPYRGLPDRNFWRRSVANVPPEDLDPVGDPAFRIARTDKVATAGSCFAQNIARQLQRAGYNYLVTEDAPPGLDADEAFRRNFRVYSARYANVYTTRQLRQLIERAEGTRHPTVPVWHRVNGRVVDPFRPEIEPDGFASEGEMLASRKQHLEAVRRMLRSCDVFVFTLGLTEGWEHVPDGSVVPMAPGIAGAPEKPEGFRFHNFTIDEVREDLLAAIRMLRKINPAVRILLTVSPVPLMATYECEHVLTATVYSKAVLRVAASAAVSEFDRVGYFPSYEIITSPSTRGRYYAEDLRTVTEEGVAHVMRTFFRAYCEPEKKESPAVNGAITDDIYAEVLAAREIVCEEERNDPGH